LAKIKPDPQGWFWKESRPERAKDKRRPIYSHFLKRHLMIKSSIELGAIFLIKYN